MTRTPRWIRRFSIGAMALACAEAGHAISYLLEHPHPASIGAAWPSATMAGLALGSGLVSLRLVRSLPHSERPARGGLARLVGTVACTQAIAYDTHEAFERIGLFASHGHHGVQALAVIEVLLEVALALLGAALLLIAVRVVAAIRRPGSPRPVRRELRPVLHPRAVALRSRALVAGGEPRAPPSFGFATTH